MSYTIKVSESGKYIEMKVVGNIDNLKAVQYNIEAHALARENGINKHLVDVRDAVNTDTVTNNYNFAYKDMPQADIDLSATVATVVSPDDHSHDFMETVSRNSGMNVRLFTDIDEAIAYLES
ncbi:MAG: hypothetical protein JXA25_02510 [Anaerolineales bacterium]|nr:hypothetical protein [Anaerolineales bacterium]